MATYDTLGATYGRTRQPDPRIAARIVAALGDAQDVINVGAGTGSYEPPRTVLALEPSRIMLAQRPQGSAPAAQAVAERLPLRDNAADAVMALLTIHHWTDVAAGIRELRRVARRRIVILTWDQQLFRERFWLVRDYLPAVAAFDDTRAVPPGRLADLLGGARPEPVPVPHDCTDGFAAAYWRRPHAYLDPQVRAGISMLAQTGEDALAPGLNRLADDLTTGRWHTRYADLLARDTVDVGYRLVVAEGV
ncbi:methyltransferase domain-containing protein [Streptomyces oryzae]|uniref:Methyltransferase domain-containing protein n=1 Tax=Streptomyces oryzae TaxID=1434886 RepID=A0ABS3XJI7_9ACTN|nr:methyltransferase domain-containing protein [Streptomyces oryzae]MBO8195575.1 methyltransferase domain-containing protein [Streptomyces oryzae]